MVSNGGLTTVRIPSLEDRVHGAIYGSDLLGWTWNRGVCHDRIGLRWLIDGFELQALVVDPKIRWFEVFRIAFVLVRAIAGLAGCPFPEDKTNCLAVKGQNVPPAARIVELRNEPGPNTLPCKVAMTLSLILTFSAGRWSGASTIRLPPPTRWWWSPPRTRWWQSPGCGFHYQASLISLKYIAITAVSAL